MWRSAGAMGREPGCHCLIARGGRNNDGHRGSALACDLLGVTTLTRADASQNQYVHAAASLDRAPETPTARAMRRQTEPYGTSIVSKVGSDADSTAWATRMSP